VVVGTTEGRLPTISNEGVRMNKIYTAVALATFGLLSLGAVALGQDGGPVTEPTVGLLASAAGLASVIFVITNLLRGTLGAASFDRWAPLVAVVIGVILAEVYVVVNGDVTGNDVLQAALVGLFAGGFSQNVNTIVTRASGTN
jgi:hypothetical protein